jgi:hypothetical protein
VPTASAGANSTQAASTQFVQTTVATGPSANNIGRNLVHNPYFNVAQRGAGPWTAAGNYTADRWQLSLSTDAASITIGSMTDTMRAQIGDEAALFYLQNVFTGNAAAGAFTRVNQNIENVARLSGKTLVLSFYAVAGAAGVKLGANAYQYFGSGGSPSTGGWALATGQQVTLATTWTRYTVTIPMPSMAGKTLGTNNDHSSQLYIYFSSGATNNAVGGNIGVQSGTVQLWGVQLELGTQATPLEKIDPGDDLRRCQRFYQGGTYGCQAYNAAGAGLGSEINFPVPMRAVPTIALSSQNYINSSGAAVQSVQSTGVNLQAIVTAQGPAAFSTVYTASADL